MSKIVEQLKRKLTSRDATVAIIGQGYVGLPLAVEFVEAGFRCIGVDISEERVAQLNAGKSYILDITDARLKEVVETGRYQATTDFEAVSEADAVSICVPTPLRKTRDPDLSYVQAACQSIAPHLKRPTVVVLESTTYPGTTHEVVTPMLLKDGRELDRDVFVSFSPERVDPGNAQYGIKNTPKVVGGVTPASTELISALYDQVIDHVHPVGSAHEAEMVKLLENTFRAVNIALVNEMMIMCDRMDIDIWQVIDAAATKPFGFMPFYPGPGIGGHCIPLDPVYLSWKAKSFGYYNRFIELATDINGNMPRFVVQKLTRALNDQGKALHGSKVLLLGIAYKPDINDLRESPAIDIWKMLKDEWGADVSFHDPFISVCEELDHAQSVDFSPEVLRQADAVVITTQHKRIDYDLVVEHASLILDTRHAIKDESAHVIRL